jgi:thiol-disulfide isomerase/thioredoxin
MPKHHAGRRRLLQTAGAGAAALGLAGLLAVGPRAAGAGQSAGGPLASLLGPREWLNTEPLQTADLAGKVVLVNFWTYSCINSLRPLPYLKAWAEKYQDRGLVVIGAHTPEFMFEHDLAKVREAASTLGVGYPIVQDNDYGIWRAFGNYAWPGFYFVGSDGRVRRQALGEGDYDRSERWLQQLLSEIADAPVTDAIEDVVGEGVQAAPDFASIRSPETYLGYGRAENFASPGGVREDLPAVYEAPGRLSLNRWGLGGAWTLGREFAVLDAPGGMIAFRFHARDLNFVLGLEPGVEAVRYRVAIDGAAPGEGRGVDADADGTGVVDRDRMYQLVRQAGSVADRTFSIEFLDPGVRAYVFTFG